MRIFKETINDIDDLEDKLSGKLPVNVNDLVILINTWGRKDRFCIYVDDIEYILDSYKKEECLPLENLDVSQIEYFTQIFAGSYYNGDLSKWDFSNANKFMQMFMCSHFNNNSLKNLNFKNVIEADDMFYESKFCGDISDWINYENTNFSEIFYNNKNFKDKYYPEHNNRYFFYSNETKEWLNENLERIREINRPKDDVVLDYFDFDNDFILER